MTDIDKKIFAVNININFLSNPNEESAITDDNDIHNSVDESDLTDDMTMNYMGAHNFKLTPLLTLKVITASWFRGEPQYYRHGLKYPASITKYIPLDEMMFDFNESSVDICNTSIKEALDYDFYGVLLWAAELRTEYYMRTSPQVLLVEAALHPKRVEFNRKNPNQFRNIASRVIQLPTDIDYQRKYYIEKTVRKTKPDLRKLEKQIAMLIEAIERIKILLAITKIKVALAKLLRI